MSDLVALTAIVSTASTSCSPPGLVVVSGGTDKDVKLGHFLLLLVTTKGVCYIFFSFTGERKVSRHVRSFCNSLGSIGRNSKMVASQLD